MNIEIAESDCSRYQDKDFLLVPATLIFAGILFLGLVVGCSTESGMNTKTIVSNCIVAFLFWFVIAAILSLAACPVFECLAHRDGFVEAVKKKIEETYGLKNINMDYSDFWDAAKKPVQLYASFENTPDIREQVMLEVSCRSTRHEATVDIHLFRSVPASSAERFEEIAPTTAPVDIAAADAEPVIGSADKLMR